MTYYYENRNIIISKQKKYYRINQKRIKEYNRLYYLKNKKNIRLRQNQNRTKIKNNNESEINECNEESKTKSNKEKIKINKFFSCKNCGVHVKTQYSLNRHQTYHCKVLRDKKITQRRDQRPEKILSDIKHKNNDNKKDNFIIKFY